MARIVTAREQAEMREPWHREAMTADTSYRYDMYDREVPHPGYGKAMHELHANPYYYDPHRQLADPEAIKAVEGTGGDPEAPVDVYRGLPQGVTDINRGDWVSPSLSYVQDWAKAQGRKRPMSIVQTKVPAKHLFTNRSSMQEWAYHGPDHSGQPLGQRTAVWRDHPWIDADELLVHDMVDPKADIQFYLRGPEDAYDEYDSEFGSWEQRVHNHPPDHTPTGVDWFHATFVDLPVGTVLAPHKGKVPWLDNPYHGGLDNRANWTWVEYDLTHSDEWLGYMVRDHGEGHLYKVKPHIGPFPWNGDAREGWVTDFAVIVERVRDAGGDQKTAAASLLMPGYKTKFWPNKYLPGAGAVTAHPVGQRPSGSNWHSGISWDQHGMITHADTKEGFQGNGLGRALHQHILDNYRPDLMHGPPHQLSADGKAFAQAVGGQQYDANEYRSRGGIDTLSAARTATVGDPEGYHIEETVPGRHWHLYDLSQPKSDRGWRYTPNVGQLKVDHHEGQPFTQWVSVNDGHRGKGLGQAMWERAGRPLHVPGAQTDEGKAWADKVGGDNLWWQGEEGRGNMHLRDARIASDVDDILDMLGPSPGAGVTPPAPSPPPDPDRYYNHLKQQEDRTHTAHAWLPTDVVNHYREYDRPTSTSDYQAVKRAVSEDGVKLPLWISANDTHGMLVEGNNRLKAAKELGIERLPVRFTYNHNVMRNEGTPVPHHPTVAAMMPQIKQQVQS